jgi:hypothetical protein
MYVDLMFISFSVGSYANGLYEGITLLFLEEKTGIEYYVIYNVKRKVVKGKRKGQLYPGNKFRVTKRMRFYKFWTFKCKLPLPSRGLTAFNECMGKLKQFKFKALIKQGNQLDKDHIFVITDEIEPKSTRNVSEISLKNSSEIQTLPDQTDTSFEAVLNTCEQNYDISKQDKKIPSDSLYSDIDTNTENSLFDTDVIDEYF